MPQRIEPNTGVLPQHVVHELTVKFVAPGYDEVADLARQQDISIGGDLGRVDVFGVVGGGGRDRDGLPEQSTCRIAYAAPARDVKDRSSLLPATVIGSEEVLVAERGERAAAQPEMAAAGKAAVTAALPAVSKRRACLRRTMLSAAAVLPPLLCSEQGKEHIAVPQLPSCCAPGRAGELALKGRFLYLVMPVRLPAHVG